MGALREVCCSRLGPRIIDRDRISDPDLTAALNAGEHPPPAADLLSQARPKETSPTSPISATAVHC